MARDGDQRQQFATQGRLPAPAGAVAGAVLADRYRLEGLIGTGGMGEVWEARHLLLDRVVAVKLLSSELRAEAGRLVSEARTLARLRHAAIVEVYDCGLLADGAPFLVMERLRGETLTEAIARSPLAPVVAARLFIIVLDALDAAHRHGVIHRDLKPDNIFLVDDGAGGVAPRLLDFGIALVAADVELSKTMIGMGTPAYMAPEQFLGDRVDERTDVWGATATLYETLVGQPPFGTDHLSTVMQRVLEAPVPFPRAGIQLDGKLWAVLARGLRKVRDQRYPTIAAMRDDLAGWLATRSGLGQPVPDTQPSRTAMPEAPAGGAAVPTRAVQPTLDDVIRKKLTPG
jgi:eukaryotic-like serine/threonine-protein kinase